MSAKQTIVPRGTTVCFAISAAAGGKVQARRRDSVGRSGGGLPFRAAGERPSHNSGPSGPILYLSVQEIVKMEENPAICIAKRKKMG